MEVVVIRLPPRTVRKIKAAMTGLEATTISDAMRQLIDLGFLYWDAIKDGARRG